MKVRSFCFESDEVELILDSLWNYAAELQDEYNKQPTDAILSEINRVKNLAHTIESFYCNNPDVYIF